MKYRKKIFLFLIVTSFTVVLLSSTSHAIIIEKGTGVDSPLPFQYHDEKNIQDSQDFIYLVVSTSIVNNSGSSYVTYSCLAVCTDEDLTLRLKVYDHESETYIDAQNQLFTKEKQRKFYAEPNIDRNYLAFSVSLTSESGETVYCSLYFEYTYDESAEPNLGNEAQDYEGWIPPEEYEEERTAWVLRAVKVGIQVLIGALVALVPARALANRYWGTG